MTKHSRQTFDAVIPRGTLSHLWPKAPEDLRDGRDPEMVDAIRDLFTLAGGHKLDGTQAEAPRASDGLPIVYFSYFFDDTPWPNSGHSLFIKGAYHVRGPEGVARISDIEDRKELLAELVEPYLPKVYRYYDIESNGYLIRMIDAPRWPRFLSRLRRVYLVLSLSEENELSITAVSIFTDRVAAGVGPSRDTYVFLVLAIPIFLFSTGFALFSATAISKLVSEHEVYLLELVLAVVCAFVAMAAYSFVGPLVGVPLWNALFSRGIYRYNLLRKCGKIAYSIAEGIRQRGWNVESLGVELRANSSPRFRNPQGVSDGAAVPFLDLVDASWQPMEEEMAKLPFGHPWGLLYRSIQAPGERRTIIRRGRYWSASFQSGLGAAAELIRRVSEDKRVEAMTLSNGTRYLVSLSSRAMGERGSYAALTLMNDGRFFAGALALDRSWPRDRWRFPRMIGYAALAMVPWVVPFIILAGLGAGFGPGLMWLGLCTAVGVLMFLATTWLAKREQFLRDDEVTTEFQKAEAWCEDLVRALGGEGEALEVGEEVAVASVEVERG